MCVGARMVVPVWCRHAVGGSSRGVCVLLDLGDALVKHRVSSIGQLSYNAHYYTSRCSHTRDTIINADCVCVCVCVCLFQL